MSDKIHLFPLPATGLPLNTIFGCEWNPRNTIFGCEWKRQADTSGEISISLFNLWRSPYRNGFVEIGVEELDWPAQSPNLIPKGVQWG